MGTIFSQENSKKQTRQYKIVEVGIKIIMGKMPMPPKITAESGCATLQIHIADKIGRCGL